MNEKEIQLDPITLKTEPCLECQEIIYDAAYSGKFKDSLKPLDDPYLQRLYGNGAVEYEIEDILDEGEWK
jgi:hypothetical protein